MTVIAWDGKTLAADKRSSFGGMHATVTKLYRINGSLVGCAGGSAQNAEMRVWFSAGCDAKLFPEPQRDSDKCVSMLVVSPDGVLRQYENSPHPFIVENKLWAIGSGRDFALAAMHLGLPADRAVEVACALDCTCGNGIDTLTFETPAADAPR